MGNINPIRYRGYYWDKEFGFYYLQTRYYDPEVGRFISPDDVSYLDPESLFGLNLYAYCGNNPVMNVDPTGTWGWEKFWQGLGYIFTSTVAIFISVSTFGAGTPLAISLIAGVTLAAGVLTGVNGLATVIEAGTNYNFIRDGIFQGNELSYDIFSGVTEGMAVAGTIILGLYGQSGRAKAARYGREWLGKGYKKVGKGRWASADGLKQMIFDNTHHILNGVRTTNHFNLILHETNFRLGSSNILSKIHLFYDIFSTLIR